MIGPVRIFEGALIDRDGCKTDARYIVWISYPSTIWFAADVIWYPEIASALSPRILANLSFECSLDGRVVPGKLEHATAIGMALTSVLGI